MTGEQSTEIAVLAKELQRHARMLKNQGIYGVPPAAAPVVVEELKTTTATENLDTPPPTPDTVPEMPIQTRDETRQPDGDLGTLQASLVGCTRCPLHSQGRTQVVFGVGNPEADVLLIGEAPGFDEDAQGIPFVGRAGQLLTKIIEGGMKMSREDVYIANVIKCRPPKNRDPLPVEVATCRPFVLQQIDYIQPKVIITLGRVATQALLDTTASITRIRGTWQSLEQWPVMPTFHPAYLLRNPAGKRDVWEDIQKVNRFLSDGIL